MIKKTALVVLVLVIGITLFANPMVAFASRPAHVVFGGIFTLKDGDVLNENLTIFGGNATLETGSVVKGDIQLFGGRLEIYGDVEGDILAAGGIIFIGNEAFVSGDITVAGAVLNRDKEAVIGGDIINETEIPLRVTRFDDLWSPVHWWASSMWNIVSFIGLAFALAALAVLVLMFMEPQVKRVKSTQVSQPMVSVGLGFLSMVVLPFLLVLLILTICLIPAAFLAVLLVVIVTAFGWIALGYEVGNRLALLLKQDWAPPFAAGIGTFGLVLISGLLNTFACIGWIFSAAVSAISIGAVVLTRFGMVDYAGQISSGIKAMQPEPDDIPSDAADDDLPQEDGDSSLTNGPGVDEGE